MAHASLPRWVSLALGVTLGACTPDTIPELGGRTPPGTGPVVRHTLYPLDLAALPFPNDLLTTTNGATETGLSLDLGLDVGDPLTLHLMNAARARDGWGTLGPISVSFDRPEALSDAALDLTALAARHDDDLDPTDDAIYLVHLESGHPVPLELGTNTRVPIMRGVRPPTTPLDPHAGEPALELETLDERADATGALDVTRREYRTELDADADGVLDVPSLLEPEACPTSARVALGLVEADERDRCLADRLTSWYERESDTLVLRPLVPLEEGAAYAVVLTDRLVAADGAPVRSPFDQVFHPTQASGARRVEAVLSQPGGGEEFGDLAGHGLAHVSYVWTFTTGTTTRELARLSAGLVGRGAFSGLASQLGELVPAPVVTPSGAPECAAARAAPFTIPGSFLTERIASRSLAELGLHDERQRAELVAGFEYLAHVVVASLVVPNLLTGGPTFEATLESDAARGSTRASTANVPVLAFVPRAGLGRAEAPQGVVLYLPRHRGSALDALPFVGAFARQGLATVALTPPGHGPNAEASVLVEALLAGTCYEAARSAVLSTRAQDLDDDGLAVDDVGLDSHSGYVAHARDVVRQTALEVAALRQALSRHDGGPPRTARGREGPEVAGDYDGNGTPDLGGPRARYLAFGDGLGATAAVLAGPLEPGLDAVVALGAAGTLVDTALTTADVLARETFLTPWLGPAIWGVPSSEAASGSTLCGPGQISLRFELPGAANGVEFGCLDALPAPPPPARPGATVVVTNAETGVRRCAPMTAAGHFRVTFPAAFDDRLVLSVFDRADGVESYAPQRGCVPVDGARTVAEVYQWGAGPVPAGATDERGAVRCEGELGCTRVGSRYYATGEPLRAVLAGAGLGRQTVALRRWLDLARHLAAPADAAASAPFYGPQAGAGQRPTAALLVAPTGATITPVDQQVMVARAMGLVPFVSPELASRVPSLAQHTTPRALYDELGGVTPDRLLVASGVLEGLARFARTPPAGVCAANEPSVSEAPECHRSCTTDTECQSDSWCDATVGACRRSPLPAAECRQAVFDPDALDEGASRIGEQEAQVPLRLARFARPAAGASVESMWEPRLAGAPFRPDLGAWAADQPTLALLFPSLDPLGADHLRAPDPCAAFATDRYVRELIARFLATGGRDLYHLSHPATHRCLERAACPFHTTLR